MERSTWHRCVVGGLAALLLTGAPPGGLWAAEEPQEQETPVIAVEPVEELIIRYLNRLSDYLFVLSRKLAKDLNAEEVVWLLKTIPVCARQLAIRLNWRGARMCLSMAVKLPSKRSGSRHFRSVPSDCP